MLSLFSYTKTCSCIFILFIKVTVQTKRLIESYTRKKIEKNCRLSSEYNDKEEESKMVK